MVNIPSKIRRSPTKVEKKMGSERNIRMKNNEIIGERKIRCEIFSALVASFIAVSQSRNVAPISNKPVYIAARSELLTGRNRFFPNIKR